MAIALHRAPYPDVTMGYLRILVTQWLSGSIDGIRLDRFRPGCVYEVGATVGSYLLALGAAEPVDDDTAITPGPGHQLFGPARAATDSLPPRRRDQAADRSRKKPKPRR
jgi:hypothetical protein